MDATRAALLMTCCALASQAVALDKIDLPPESREVASPGARYVLVISTADAWKSKHAKAELLHSDGETRQSVWTLDLPQEYGPRYAVVSDDGSVLLVEEWIHVKSRYAVMAVDRAGRVVAQHSFDDVQGVLEVPVRDVVQMASLGWWVTTPPVLDEERGVATIGTGGKQLGVRLSDGRLSVEPGSDQPSP